MNEENKQLIDEYGNIHLLAQELARGGQGVVYRTTDEDLAIKQPLDGLGQPDVNINLSTTFQRIRTLPLPHGIPISLPLSILRDEPGYVMKLLQEMKPFEAFSLSGVQRKTMEKEQLPHWLSEMSDKKMALSLVYYAQTGSTRRRLYALYKCAAVLARLHNTGLVYGDISANNCFIGEGIPCECWLIDADNLRFELPSGGNTVYTPHLGAPEIVQGNDSSRPRTDCWAFAVMAFNMLALCHPFIGKKVLEPEEEAGWDAEPNEENMPADLDEQAYAGYLPFIDDVEDDSNELPNGGLPRALVFTEQLRRLFQETLGAGRIYPHRRPAMLFWAIELARAFDNSIVCSSCGMSFFYIPGVKQCPYCQTLLPTYAVARTKYWQMNILYDGETKLPQRLFQPFSLVSGDWSEYEAEVNLTAKKIKPVRGTTPFPSELNFTFEEGEK